MFQNVNLPRLHGFSVMLSVHDGNESLPPQGVFDWHYLQCVLLRFGTTQYRGVPNIQYHVNPFQTASDSSDDERVMDDDADPPWPSYRFDRYLEQQWKAHWDQERREEMLEWASRIPSGIYTLSECTHKPKPSL